MRCPMKTGEGQEIVIAYGARTLSPRAEAEWELHLAMCEECSRAARAQRALWEELDEWRPLPVSPDFDRKLYERIAREEEQRSWKFRLGLPDRVWRQVLPVAAACLILLAVIFTQFQLFQPDPVIPAQSKVDMERVERALDDIDMLKTLGALPPAPVRAGTSKQL